MANAQTVASVGAGSAIADSGGVAAPVEFTVMIIACGPVLGGGGGLVYAIAVTQPVQSWTVLRNHNDFTTVGEALSQIFSGLPRCPLLPSDLLAVDDHLTLNENSYLSSMFQVRNEIQHWLGTILMYPGVRESSAVRNFLTVAANTIPPQYEGVAWTQFNTPILPIHSHSPTQSTETVATANAPGLSCSAGSASSHHSTTKVPPTTVPPPHAVSTIHSNPSSPAGSHNHALSHGHSNVDDMEMDDMFLVEDDVPGGEHNSDGVYPEDDDYDEDYIPSASERYKPTDEKLTEDDEMEMINELAGGEVEMVEDIGSLAQSLGASHLGRSLQLQAELKHPSQHNTRTTEQQQQPQRGLNVGASQQRIQPSGAEHQGGIGGAMAKASQAGGIGMSIGFSDSFHQRPPQSAPRLDSFKMIKVIGKGSFGKVFLVKEVKTGQIYALKVLRKDNIIKRNQVEHTKTERSVLGYVKHPFIVGMNMAFQSKDKLYFVLDYCAGGELFFHLGKLGRFPEPRARFYAAEIILAISYVHTLDIIYRDLKPENVLLDSQGHIRLTDFGLSKEGISNSSSGANSFCGTPEYLAPEILNRQGHGRAVDWWSLGALLYEMLTGLPPFYCQDRERLFEKIRKSELHYPASVSRPAKSLLKGLLTKDSARRLGSGPTDADEIRQHEFFVEINWDKLAKGEVQPPWKPNINGILDTSQFDKEFTNMPVFSPQSLQRMHGFGATPTADNPFEGFTFTDRILHGPGAQAWH